MSKFSFVLKIICLGINLNLQAMGALVQACSLAPLVPLVPSKISRTRTDEKKFQDGEVIYIGNMAYKLSACLFCKSLTGYRCGYCSKAAYCSLACHYNDQYYHYAECKKDR